MLRLISRRLAQAVPTLLAVSFVVFFLVHLMPGDPAAIMVGERATEERIEEIRAEYGFDEPLPIQYAEWLGRAVQGDLGTSLRSREPVAEVLLKRMTPTVSLMALSTLMAVVFGLIVGLAAGLRPNTRTDRAITGFTMLGVAIPNFWLGMLLAVVFAVWLGLLPAVGFPGWEAGMWPALQSLLLPAFALSTFGMATIARQTRAGLIEIMTSDFIRTHRAKGLRRSRIVLLHAVKNVSIPLLTLGGLTAARLLGGTVVVESLFAIPGLGNLVHTSALQLDYPVIQGAVLLLGVMTLLINVVVDITYRYADPRVRPS